MINYKLWISVLGVGLGFVSYIPYWRNIVRGKTRPHAFSWLIWGLTAGIALAAELFKGAGIGAWVILSDLVMCWAICLVALVKGQRTFPKMDWLYLSLALGSIIIWALTNEPLWAIILLAITDVLAFLPTFRKSFYHPDEETLVLYVCSAIKYSLGIVALQDYAFSTWFYLGVIVVTNSTLVGFTLWRRWHYRRMQTQQPT